MGIGNNVGGAIGDAIAGIGQGVVSGQLAADPVALGIEVTATAIGSILGNVPGAMVGAFFGSMLADAYQGKSIDVGKAAKGAAIGALGTFAGAVKGLGYGGAIAAVGAINKGLGSAAVDAATKGGMKTGAEIGGQIGGALVGGLAGRAALNAEREQAAEAAREAERGRALSALPDLTPPGIDDPENGRSAPFAGGLADRQPEPTPTRDDKSLAPPEPTYNPSRYGPSGLPGVDLPDPPGPPGGFDVPGADRSGGNFGGSSPSTGRDSNTPDSTGTTGGNAGGSSPSTGRDSNTPDSTGTTGGNAGSSSPSTGRDSNTPDSTGTTGGNAGSSSPSTGRDSNTPDSTGTTGGNAGEGDGEPILLDLDGDSVRVTPLSSSDMYFDMVGDGLKRRTAWAGKGDGVLAIDANGDGKITEANEIVFTKWDPSAATDFEAVRNVFDTNRNGKLDAGDTRWGDFRVVVDGQVKTLTELGIASIDLVSNKAGYAFSDGSGITGEATFTRTNGTTGVAADASLVFDAEGVNTSVLTTQNADGSTTILTIAKARDGSISATTKRTITANGLNETLVFDDDGDGVTDRSQTIARTTSGTQKIETTREFDEAGRLVAQSILTRSADGSFESLAIDRDGDGKNDTLQTTTKAANGTRTIVLKTLNPDGSTARSETRVVGADGMSVSTSVDANGDGVIDRIITESTLKPVTGGQTETVATRANNGLLLSKRVTMTSADLATRIVSTDQDGDGTFERVQTITTARDAAGAVTTSVTTKSQSSATLSAVSTTLSKDGLSRTTKSDVNGDGVADEVATSLTTLAADGSSTRTESRTSGNGTLLEKTSIVTSAGGAPVTITRDQDGDGKADLVTVYTKNAQSGIVETQSAYAANDKLLAKSVTTTSADGLTITNTRDINGDGVVDSSTSDVTSVATDGTRTRTIESKNGTSLVSRQVETTSANGLSITLSTDMDGDGTIDSVRSDVTSLGSDGSKTQTIITKTGNGVQTGKATALTSADRRTLTTSRFIDNDAQADEVEIVSRGLNGSTTQTLSRYSATGSLVSRVISETSADGLKTKTTSDVNGDGLIDETRSSVTSLQVDGSSIQTAEIKAQNGLLLAKTVTTLSGNGLVATVVQDRDGNGVNDTISEKTITFLSDGRTQTILRQKSGSGSLGSETINIVSADGLTSSQKEDVDGDGTINRTSASTTIIGQDGSRTTTVSSFNANQALTRKSIETMSGNGRESAVSVDRNGDGLIDYTDVSSKLADGSVLRVLSDYGTASKLLERASITTSADGLTVTTAWDANGDGLVDRIKTDKTVLAANGSNTRTVETRAGTLLISKSITTTSANGYNVSTQYDVEGDSRTDLTVSALKTLGADGAITETSTITNGSNALLEKREISSSANGLSRTEKRDTTGAGFYNRTSNLVLTADGASVETLSDYSNTTTLRDRRVVTRSADGLSRKTTWDVDGDGAIDSSFSTVTTIAADGARSQTATVYDKAGKILSRVLDVTSGNGSTQTTSWDVDGDGTVDRIKSATTVLEYSGATRVTSSFSSGAGVLLSRTVVDVSFNGLVRTTTIDRNGDTLAEESLNDVSTLQADGSLQRITAMLGANGQLLSKAISTSSADGLTSVTERDLDGDGDIDERSLVALTTHVAGSSEKTITRTRADNSVIDRVIVSENSDHTVLTTQKDADGDGSLDEIKTLQTRIDGSTVETTDHYLNGRLIDRMETKTAYDGRSRVSNWWIDGETKSSIIRTESIDARADGSTTQEILYKDGDGAVQRRGVTVTSADGLTITTTLTSNQNTFADSVKITSVHADQSTNVVETINDETGKLFKTVTTDTTSDQWTKTETVSTVFANSATESSVTKSIFHADGSFESETFRKKDNVDDAFERQTKDATGNIVTTMIYKADKTTLVSKEVKETLADSSVHTSKQSYNPNGSLASSYDITTSASGLVTSVNGFNPATDKLDKDIIDPIYTMQQVRMEQRGADAYVFYGENKALRFENTAISSLTSSIFTLESSTDVAGETRYTGTPSYDASKAAIVEDNSALLPTGAAGLEAYETAHTGANAPKYDQGTNYSGTSAGQYAGTGVFNLNWNNVWNAYNQGISYSWQNFFYYSIFSPYLDYDGYFNYQFNGNIAMIGADFSEQIHSWEYNDVIYANAGDDYVAAYGGNDLIYGGAGYDTIWAGAGYDNVYGGSESDTIYGEGENDLLYGEDGDDTLIAGSGDDYLDGGFGNDGLHGEDGNDYIVGRSGNDYIGGGSGSDAIYGEDGDDGLLGGSENDYIDGGLGNDGLYGEAGDDTLLGRSGNDYIVGGSDNDLIYGEDGDDGLVGGSENDYIDGGSGNDGLYGEEGNDYLIGGGGNDYMVGGTGNDIVYAGEGDDGILGGAENDYLNGGNGDDGLYGEAGNDQIIGGSGNDRLYGEDGSDFLYGGEGQTDTGTGNDTLDGGIGDDVLSGQDGEDMLDGGDGNDIIFAGEGNDFAYGGAGVDLLYGGLGNDTLMGGAGSDLLHGEAGSDLLYGGTNDDLLKGDDGEDWLYGDEGNDLLEGGNDADRLFGIVGNDTLKGQSGADYLDGGNGDDLLFGGEGNDVLIASSGNDTLNGGEGDDALIFTGARADYRITKDPMTGALTITDLRSDVEDGVDSAQNIELFIFSDVSVTLPELFATQPKTITLSGDTANNILNGGNGSDHLNGLEGDDVLSGNAGKDTLIGGAGNDNLDGGLDADTMMGGLGNDIYIVDNVSDIVSEELDEGTDTIRTKISSYILGNNVENISYIGTTAFNGAGNTLNNVMVGANSSDTLDGKAGADTLIGGLGNDTYIVDNIGDVVTEALNEGTDSIRTTLASYTLGNNVENLTYIGTAGFTGTGNALNNVMVGANGNDVLSGGAGNDTLDGKAGADTLIGGLGNDIYTIDNAGDVVTEGLNEGTDSVSTTLASYTLGNNVENLTYIGTAGFTGTGNALNNVMIGANGSDVLNGGAGNDALDGKAGADTLIGGLGNDTYTVDNIGDVVTEGLNEGSDGVSTTLASYTLGNNVENLTYIGTTAFTGTGNALNNVMVGANGNDVLSGGAGDDTFEGLLGNDLLTGGIGADRFIFTKAGFGNDVISDFEGGSSVVDVLDFNKSMVSDWATLLSKTTQSGMDTLISITANDTVTLKNFNMANLNVNDVKFV
jgi:Ca2+-binding RTX toxin-like protein